MTHIRVHYDWPFACMVVLIVVFAALAHEVIVTNPAVVDEYAHVPAGVSYWDLGRFYIYRENPPLVQALAALPVYLSRANMDYRQADPANRSEWAVGEDFGRANASRYGRLLCRARSVIVILSVACGVLISRWSAELYGRPAGAVSAALWFLDPTVLAFSAIVTSDAGAAAFGLLSVYLFWRFLSEPGWGNVLLPGCALGVAEASKFSLLVLFPAFTLLLFLAPLSSAGRADGATRSSRRALLRSLAVFFAAIVTLNALYRFEGTFTSLRTFDFKSRALSGLRNRSFGKAQPGNRFRSGVLGYLPVPLPADYLLGLDSEKNDEELGFIDLRGGLVRARHWYSPFLTLFRKLPLGTLVLFGALAAAVAFDLRRPSLAFWAVWIPPIFMISLFCTQTGLNWVARYLLIALPFLFVGTGRLVQASWDRPWARWLIIACLLWNAAALLRVRPYYISYGNETVGGVSGAQKVFLGSNFDWGQDIIRLRRWCDKSPSSQPIAVALYTATGPGWVGLRVRPLPALLVSEAEGGEPESPGGPGQPFYWAISSNVLNGMPGSVMLEDGSIRWALVRSPLLMPENAFARVGSSIYVFRVDPHCESSTSAGGIPADALRGCVEVNVDTSSLVSP